MPTDFEPSATGRMSALTGMVQPMLDTDGKPVYVNVADSLVASATTFSQWYRDTPSVNHTTAGTLTLWSNGQQYVNRYGPNGEQWIVTAQAYYCGNVGRGCSTPPEPHSCTSRRCDDELYRNGRLAAPRVVRTGTTATYQMAALDGTPFFFRSTRTRSARGRAGRRATAPPYTELGGRGGDAEAQLPFHQRGPLLVPVRLGPTGHINPTSPATTTSGCSSTAGGGRSGQHPHARSGVGEGSAWARRRRTRSSA
jgi:hypothetical protein